MYINCLLLTSTYATEVSIPSEPTAKNVGTLQAANGSEVTCSEEQGL